MADQTSSPVALMQQLHDEHAGALWGYCLRLTGHDRARAEDLLQETLLRAWRSSRLLDESRGSVRSWLFTVARNLAIDEWRTKRTRTEVAVAEPPEPAGDARDHTDRLLLSWVVADALVAAQRRPPRRAPVLLLPRHVGRRRRPPARRPGRHREVPHPLRPARPAARPRGDGGDRMSDLPALWRTPTPPTSSASLSPTDRLEFERHLPGCERCRRSVAELAGLPGLLGRVPRRAGRGPAPFRTAARDGAARPGGRRTTRAAPQDRAGHARRGRRHRRRGPGRGSPPGRA